MSTPIQRRKPGPKPRMEIAVATNVVLDASTRDAAAVEATRRGLSLSEYLRMLIETKHPRRKG